MIEESRLTFSPVMTPACISLTTMTAKISTILSRSQSLGELGERRPVRNLVHHHPVDDLLPQVERDEPLGIRFEEAYQVEDALSMLWRYISRNAEKMALGR